jgi:DNA-binding transcriptional LysR family regulator
MNIRFLETAICLARLRNFRATAAALNITPAAVSNRIAAMEVELGVRLFDRDSREVRLTPEGLAFIQGAGDVVARYQDLVGDLKPRAAVVGSVKIGLLPSMALTMLPGMVAFLREQFPMVRLSIVTDTSSVILHKLRQREIDIAVCIAPEDTTDLHVADLCHLGMFWIVDPKILQHDVGDRLRIEDLLAYPIISYEIGTHNHARMRDYFADLVSDGSVVHYSNSLATTIGMIASGIGISVLPPVCIQRELREGTLAVLRVDPAFPPTKYSIIRIDRDDRKIVRLADDVARDVAAAFCRQYDDSLAAFADSALQDG